MRHTRTGLALLLAAALLGCHRREKPAAIVEPEPPARAVESSTPPPHWNWDGLLKSPPSVKPSEPATEREVAVDSRRPVFPDPSSAISRLVAANGNLVPANGSELIAALNALGDPVQLPVSFSSVALDSSLKKPRIVFAARGENEGELHAPTLSGRLFLAVNFGTGLEANHVHSIEFISWNARRRGFDFGVIENLDREPVLKTLDGVRCFTCHKNRGPILGVGPWSNTVTNDGVKQAAEQRFELQSSRFARYEMDGIDCFRTHAEAVDRMVRDAADRLMERRIVAAFAKSAPGRAILVEWLIDLSHTTLPPGGSARIAKILAASRFTEFVQDASTIRRTTASSRLIDPDPEVLMGSLARRRPWSAISPADVLKYDDLRAAGDHRMGTTHAPSNPKAFEPNRVPIVRGLVDVINPEMLERVLGLTAGDRRFFEDALKDAAAGASSRTTWPVTTQDLARRMFTGPIFEASLRGGDLPERDEFKDRFVAALREALRFHDNTGRYWVSRERYASGPLPLEANWAVVAEALPTTACLGCHDVRKPGQALPFNPIPPLAFDPFDASSRAAWLKSTDSSRRAVTLGRMLKRMTLDMPPADSAEHGMFREKDPESFRLAIEALERELARARR